MKINIILLSVLLTSSISLYGMKKKTGDEENGIRIHPPVEKLSIDDRYFSGQFRLHELMDGQLSTLSIKIIQNLKTATEQIVDLDGNNLLHWRLSFKLNKEDPILTKCPFLLTALKKCSVYYTGETLDKKNGAGVTPLNLFEKWYDQTHKSKDGNDKMKDGLSHFRDWFDKKGLLCGGGNAISLGRWFLKQRIAMQSIKDVKSDH
jgi:hypothetical protein